MPSSQCDLVLFGQVEHIIREDYMVEAMEIIEMFCDLLLARFGIIDKMKYAVSLTSKNLSQFQGPV